jgi:hypothetical protein
MKRVVLIALLSVLSGAAQCAESVAEQGADQGAYRGADQMARVITDVAKPVQCIAPIEVYNLDGRLVRKNAMGFDLEPGRHTLVGTARIDSVNCPAMRGNQALDIPPLDYEFEAGRIYYVGLEHQSSNQQQWRFVVWKVE